MRKLFFLLPNIDSCRAVVAELENAGVPERHLHVVASLEQPLGDLPEAGVLQKTEILHGLEWGLGLGAVAGFLGGLLIVKFPPIDHGLGTGTLWIAAVLGAAFGALVSALMSSHEPNHSLDKYEQAIENGEILLLVDLARSEVEATKRMVLEHHPEAEFGVAKPGR